MDDSRAEELADAHGPEALRQGPDALQRRMASAFPQPLRDPCRYLKAWMQGGGGRAAQVGESALAAREAEPAGNPGAAAGSPRPPGPAEQRRPSHWAAAWWRRRHEPVSADTARLPADEQARLCQLLAEDMAARQAHPSIRQRPQASGWQHPMVLHDMLRCYARSAIGEHRDQPTPEQLLAVAAPVAAPLAEISRPAPSARQSRWPSAGSRPRAPRW